MEPVKRARNYLAWRFLLSLLLHLGAAPLVSTWRSNEPEQEQSYPLSLSTRAPLPMRLVPPPTPTPAPKRTLPPRQPALWPRTRPVSVHPLKTTASPHRLVRAASVSRPVPLSDDQGVAHASLGDAPVVFPATAMPTPAPTGPSCSEPHVGASTKNTVQPEYPEIAREQGAVGTTEVQVTLDERGGVVAVAVAQSSGNKALDEAALAAARASTFSPEIDDCQPVGGTYLFRADFTAQ
ncbi:MAG TPA: TonB family protein [Candidatus Acidoferrales bacterium]|nr:TonB family protein [Candidatus Acidoferrales bacterium]